MCSLSWEIQLQKTNRLYWDCINNFITSANKAEVMWSFFLSVCVSFCEQDYWKNSEPISLKLGIMIVPTNWKNWLGGVLVPSMDSGSLVHFRLQFIAELGFSGDLKAFLNTVTTRLFTKLGEMTDADKIMNPQHLGRSSRHPDPD